MGMDITEQLETAELLSRAAYMRARKLLAEVDRDPFSVTTRKAGEVEIGWICEERRVRVYLYPEAADDRMDYGEDSAWADYHVACGTFSAEALNARLAWLADPPSIKIIRELLTDDYDADFNGQVCPSCSQYRGPLFVSPDGRTRAVV